MKEELRQEYDRIQAPEELKQRTKQLMRERLRLEKPAAEGDPVGDGKRGGAKKKSLKNRTAVIGSVALAAAALCITIYAFGGRNGFYVTPVSDESYYAEVEVSDGIIHFAERGEMSGMMPNASKAEAGDGAGENASGEEEGETAKAGNSGSIRIKEGTGSLPKAGEEEYSYVAGEKFLVTAVKKEEPVYTAYLERDGILYTVTAEGVSQKQFLDYIYRNFFKK